MVWRRSKTPTFRRRGHLQHSVEGDISHKRTSGSRCRKMARITSGCAVIHDLSVQRPPAPGVAASPRDGYDNQTCCFPTSHSRDVWSARKGTHVHSSRRRDVAYSPTAAPSGLNAPEHTRFSTASTRLPLRLSVSAFLRN